MAKSRSPYGFIVQCLNNTGKDGIAEMRRDIRDRSWKWESLIQVASAELVLPALLERMQELGLASELPAEIADFFLSLRELSLQRNRQLLDETVRIGRILNDIGIEPLVLKGVAYLMSGVFRDFSTRFISDIDILLSPSMLMPAVDALKKDGYVPWEGNFGHHYFPLRRRGGAWVELHHSLGGGTSRSIIPSEEVLKNSLCLDFAGVKIRVPCPQHLVLHHIVHAQIHHGHSEGIWPSLRTVYDLVSLQHRFKDSFDWPSIENRFRVNRRRGALAMHLLLAEERLGAKYPIQIRMTPGTALRWSHIKVLRKYPRLRWIDPLYLLGRLIIPRGRMLGNLLRISAGRSYLLRNPFRAIFYVSHFSGVVRPFGEIARSLSAACSKACSRDKAAVHSKPVDLL
jgi:hypothetical protein